MYISQFNEPHINCSYSRLLVDDLCSRFVFTSITRCSRVFDNIYEVFIKCLSGHKVGCSYVAANNETSNEKLA